MSEISPEMLEEYLSSLYDGVVEVERVSALGTMEDVEFVLKDYGYGTPLRIDLKVDGEPRSLVFNTVRPGGFGHDLMPDRAAILLWQAGAFNTLPGHVRAVDVGAFTDGGKLKTLGDCTELFLVTELVEGTEYFKDLDRIKETGEAMELDVERVMALARYLADIHRVKRDDPGYYERRTRELIGHNECILGLTDSYPTDLEYITPGELAEIEKRCIDWRWRNKVRTHRLSQVHGDFHPFNLLFRESTDFTALDRSRGDWGEPADDVAGLGINYLFWGLLHKGSLEDPFKGLWDAFFETYLEESGDREVLEVIQPYLSWRALVVASPVWYPHISLDVRRRLLGFARNVLDVEVFEPDKVDSLLGASP